MNRFEQSSVVSCADHESALVHFEEEKMVAQIIYSSNNSGILRRIFAILFIAILCRFEILNPLSRCTFEGAWGNGGFKLNCYSVHIEVHMYTRIIKRGAGNFPSCSFSLFLFRPYLALKHFASTIKNSSYLSLVIPVKFALYVQDNVLEYLYSSFFGWSKNKVK